MTGSARPPGNTDRDPRWPGIERSRRRSLALVVVVIGAFTAIAARLTYIQAFTPPRYRSYAHAQDTVTTVLPALRGAILDRTGMALALSQNRPSVIADPHQISDPAGEAAQLAPLVDLPVATVTTDLEQPSGYVVVAAHVTTAVASTVDGKRLPGIVTRDSLERFYPAGQLAAPIIGAVDSSGVGASGLEYGYNQTLTGTPGRMVQEVDPLGRPIAGGTIEDRPATTGGSLELSLYEPLQYQVEQALAQAVMASHGRSGIAMVMDTHTGGLLAVADLSEPGAGTTSVPALPIPLGAGGTLLRPATRTSVPQPVESPSADAFTRIYEPGSVEKLVTVSAALSTGAVTPTEVFPIPNAYPVDGVAIHDAENHGAESLSVTGIVAQSSNIGAVQVAQRTGGSALYRYMSAFGIGSVTPVHFPGESAGIITPLSQLTPVTLATMAYGEGLAVTAAQMIGAYNTIANGGVYVAPHLVRAIVGPHGHQHPVALPAPHRVVSATVARQMTAILEQVVAAGTGTAAAISPYAVAGKTGTAQYRGPSGYEAGRTVASFAGFAPAQHPAVTVMVVIDDTPDYGAQAAAPAFATITRDALAYLATPPYGPQPAPETIALPGPAGGTSASAGAGQQGA